MIKTVGVFMAALAALATTSALSLRSDSTVADSVSKSVDAGGGSRDVTPRTQATPQPVDSVQDADAIPAEPLGTLPPEGAVAAVTIDIGTDDTSDGALSVTAQNAVIDLSLAASLCNCDGIDQDGDGNFIDDACRWDCPSPTPGKGVYDAEKWAVVFKYSSVTVSPAYNSCLSFRNHPSRAPVVWLVGGDVRVSQGVFCLGGQGSQGCSDFAEPGAGGFRGGRGRLGSTYGSGGFGPGGGDHVVNFGHAAGSHATPGGNNQVPASPTYGNAFALPLMGGSGGASRYNDCNAGGAGGGAILIASKGTITLDGGINVNGGEGSQYGSGGSAGAIRLIANIVTGAGALRAQGGGTPYGGGKTGGDGRIFVQSNVNALTDAGVPAWLWVPIDDPTTPEIDPPLIWPDSPAADAPEIWAESMTVIDRLTGKERPYDVPRDPRAKLDLASPPVTDTAFDTEEDATLHIAARDMPQDWLVKVRVVPVSGDTFTVDAGSLVPDANDPALSHTTALLPLPRGIGAIQVRAFKPPSP